MFFTEVTKRSFKHSHKGRFTTLKRQEWEIKKKREMRVKRNTMLATFMLPSRLRRVLGKIEVREKLGSRYFFHSFVLKLIGIVGVEKVECML